MNAGFRFPGAGIFGKGYPGMEFIVISTLNGLVYGLLLFMVSAGLTLIFGMMGIVNFAHASFYMLGAYLSFTIARISNFWLALLIAPLIVMATGMFIERFMLRRVHGFGTRSSSSSPSASPSSSRN